MLNVKQVQTEVKLADKRSGCGPPSGQVASRIWSMQSERGECVSTEQLAELSVSRVAPRYSVCDAAQRMLNKA